ncbi:3-isopropylmalate dehydratase small subunit [Antrihabitans sp. YC3-6]|uniref:3-isopropylmalate dehydratase small subunit n=1 Tax=Antrihabitans stalagmiti TaxID=2799499 RepID=A0A934U3D3_9NOCA|nr:3-isopropylmalate dehydratase small subunit [Antrihabitans stalagmiti]MBJ8339452.1 3-isopropylmalate dehydratase small subunit [Antrihabitans stalagmiti]
MDAFTRCSGIAIPLRRSNIDTDQICPSAFMKRVTRTGYDDALFATWRADPTFILNTTPFDHGKILIVGPDFGTGSSREHAVWALLDYGIRVVVSSRFADIFRSNAGKNGLLTAQVTGDEVEQLWNAVEDDACEEVAVDLTTRVITAGPHAFTFTINDHTRWQLLNGLDDIAITEQHNGLISAFEQKRPSWKPRTL